MGEPDEAGRRPEVKPLNNHTEIRWDIGLVMAALGFVAWMVWRRDGLLGGLDYQLLHHYYRGYLKAGALAGEWRLWNPYVGLGRPFVADVEAENRRLRQTVWELENRGQLEKGTRKQVQYENWSGKYQKKTPEPASR